MRLTADIPALHAALADLRELERPGATGARAPSGTLGFVPTMGALHAGHAALLRRARAENRVTVCSLFVNPTQFNDPGDLEAYPRTPEKDAELARKVGIDVLFAPPAAVIYPPGAAFPVPVDLGDLARGMEGAFRPGHFEGVATVVHRLLDIVGPDRLYLGEKDYQQLAVVRHLVRSLGLPVEVVGCPTVREPDGLAMSSRNRRLRPEDRRRAPAIYQTLRWARQRAATTPAPALQAAALRRLADASLRPEYVEIVDPDTLRPLGAEDDARRGRACAAAWAGPVRLIDNLALTPEA